ncbi:ATP-binding cassette domain-containing protein [Brevundimonas vesicularis]|uniref:ABC transporter ATP-binding protein n=1 Tax=Brevundimonas vesicularis TaxID=41276 RepID=UPI0030BC2ABA
MSSPLQPGLRVEDISLTYRTAQRPVFQNLSFDLSKGGRLALLGRNGQGKSTLIKLLGGIMSPSSGRISWGMSQSWPIGFNGGFQGSLSGLDNIRFLARIYGRNFLEVRERVDDFAELGRSLRLPVRHYSSGMRARLAFGLSLAIEFDCYLIDELVAVGDARFQRKCQYELFEQRANRAFLMASHDTGLIQSNCDRALLIEGGKAKVFDDINEAVEIYKWLRTA